MASMIVDGGAAGGHEWLLWMRRVAIKSEGYYASVSIPMQMQSDVTRHLHWRLFHRSTIASASTQLPSRPHLSSSLSSSTTVTRNP